MNTMDVMILPSRREGFGCVITEANACGVPVVGSDTGGISEAIGIKENIVADGDEFEKRIAKRVVEVANSENDKEYLSKYTVENFSWDKIAEDEASFYGEGDIRYMGKVAKATVALMIVTMLSKILGFGRELVLGALYGATVYSDEFIAASNIPKVLFTLVATALATTFIPLYYENLREGGEEKALRFSNNILNITIILGIILSTISFIFAEPIVKIFAMGF